MVIMEGQETAGKSSKSHLAGETGIRMAETNNNSRPHNSLMDDRPESDRSSESCGTDLSSPYELEIDYLKENFKGQCKVLDWSSNFVIIKLNPKGLDLVLNFKLPRKSNSLLVPDVSVRSTCIPEEQVFDLVDFLKNKFESLHGINRLEVLVNMALMWIKEEDISLKSPPKSPKGQKHKKKLKKSRPKENDGLDKKPSMKTAEDVIKRIKWDENLPEDEFLVGYIDRFKGIMEKYFTAFSWEDIATVDYTDLAIPKHRIQYFKYRGEKVWDKNDRFDHVFGSLGSNITILDVIRRHESQDVSSNTSQSDSLDTMSATSLNTLDTNPHPTSANMDYLRENDEFSSDDESSDSDDGIEVIVGGAANKNMQYCSDNDEYDEDQSDEKYWQDKMRPNHFLALRITDGEVRKSVTDIQDSLLAQEVRYSECCIPNICLHLTLCTVGLDTPEQVQNAVKCLQEVKSELFNIVPKEKVLKIKGLDNFFNRVVYGKVEYPPEFLDFVHHLKLCLMEYGIDIRDNHDFVPHITIMKISRPVARATGRKYVAPWLYSSFSDTDFGQQEVNNIHLCEMGDQRQLDGFYITATSVTA